MKTVLRRRGRDPRAPTCLKDHVKSSSFAQHSRGRLYIGLHPATFLEPTCASLRVVGQHTGIERKIRRGSRDELVALVAEIDLAKIPVADIYLAFVLGKLGNGASCHGDRLSLCLDAERNLRAEPVADHQEHRAHSTPEVQVSGRRHRISVDGVPSRDQVVCTGAMSPRTLKYVPIANETIAPGVVGPVHGL